MGYNRTESVLYKLLQTGTRRSFPSGQVIDGFADESGLHLIAEGYVKRYLITKEGNKSIQVIYGPEDIFPLTPVYKNIFGMDIYSGPEQYYYEAITELKIHSLSKNQFLEQLDKNPSAYKDLYLAAGLRLNSYIHRLESISLGVANMKILDQLHYLADVFGEETPEGTLIKLPLTHKTIAEILDLTRETVSLHMGRFQKKGVISVKNKHVTIIRNQTS